jgi:hypothetical protein
MKTHSETREELSVSRPSRIAGGYDDARRTDQERVPALGVLGRAWSGTVLVHKLTTAL